MALSDDLKSQVATIFRDAWGATSGRVVPVPSSVGLGNQAIEFNEAVVLYADLDGSTAMVDNRTWQFSAEIYKTYLHCAAKIIKSEDGVITAYDGDRVMAVFIGERMRSRAALVGLKLNYAVRNIISPAIERQYPQSDFVLKHVVGVDVSEIRATRTGVRGDNDLVWVGRAANYAAKLTALPSDSWQIWVTADIYNRLAADLKRSNAQSVWEPRLWMAMNRMQIYGSNWGFPI